MDLPPPTPRDWSEDASHENGQYLNQCPRCCHHFYGHISRRLCRTCWAEVKLQLPSLNQPFPGIGCPAS